MPEFNIEQAKKAGYSDAELAQYLAQTRGFNYSGAKQAGHSDADILKYLSDIPQSASEAATTGAAGRYIEGVKQEVDPTELFKNPKGAIQALGNQIFRKGLPGVGEMITGPFERGAQDISEGNVAGGLGRMTAGALPWASKGIGSTRVGLRSFTTQPQEAAIATAEARGVPVNLAQRTQNPFFAGLQGITSRIPGTASKSAGFALNQQTSIENAARILASEVSPTGRPWKVVKAGESLEKGLSEAGFHFKELADEGKDVLMTVAEKKATKEVITGYEPSQILDANGQPIMIPVTERMVAPVNLKSVKTGLKPTLDMMEKTIPAAQKDSNPALAAIRQIINGSDTVSLDVALENLSALKKQGFSLARYARTKSQGKASYAASLLQEEIDKAVSDLGPHAQRALKLRDTATVRRHEVKDLDKVLFGSEKLRRSPVRAINMLMQPGDKGIVSLRFTAKNAPYRISEIASSYLDNLLKDASEVNKAGWTGAYKRFAALGDETKQTVYGPKAAEIEDFLRFASMSTARVNPSESATVGGLGAIAMYTVRHPIQGTAYILGARHIANTLMYAPDGAKLLKEGMRVPIVSPAANTVAGALLINAGVREGYRD